jgi:hypothetical protein
MIAAVIMIAVVNILVLKRWDAQNAPFERRNRTRVSSEIRELKRRTGHDCSREECVVAPRSFFAVTEN